MQVLQVKFTEDQLRILEEEAARQGLGTSTLVRAYALKAVEIERTRRALDLARMTRRDTVQG